MNNINELNIFFAYSRENFSLRNRLDKHLSTLKRNRSIKTWFDGVIDPGQEWEQNIVNALEEADIILLLISADFISSDYCYNVEMVKAIEKHDKGEAVVIPVILTHCDWSETPFSKLQVLPKNAIPIMDERWHTEDKAMTDVAIGIRTIVSRTIKEREDILSNYYDEIISLKEEKEQLEGELKYSKIKQEELEDKIKLYPETKLLDLNNEKDAQIRKQEIIIFELKRKLKKHENTTLDKNTRLVLKKAEIMDIGQLYTTLNKASDVNWINDEVKTKACSEEWKKTGFFPEVKMTGEIIDSFGHPNHGALIFILKVNDKYYVPIGAAGVKLV